MTTAELIKYLRLQVDIRDPDDENAQDKAYLSMSDDDILLYLNVVLTRDFADVPSLDLLPSYAVYPLILLAKKELYYALAVASAPNIDLGADNNNYLKRSQRFEHYMKLIAQADEEYKDYMENGGGLSADGAGNNTLTSFDVLLANRYYTKRYYAKGVKPAPSLYVDEITDTTIAFHWTNSAKRFAWCNVYLSLRPVIDPYQIGASKVSDRSALIQHFTDPRQVSLRVEGLSPSTTYYIAVEVTDMSGLVGYYEVSAVTADPEPVPEPGDEEGEVTNG